MSKPIPKGSEVEGDMTASLDPRFLNSLVLQAALEKSKKDSLEVTIDRIEHHDILKYENGQTDDDAYLLYFKGSDKPLKLNVTNSKAIMAIHGTMGAEWKGKTILLHLQTAYRPDLKAKGPCVRVKAQAPTATRTAANGGAWE